MVLDNINIYIKIQSLGLSNQDLAKLKSTNFLRFLYYDIIHWFK